MVPRRVFLQVSLACGLASLAATVPGLRTLAQPLPRRRSLHEMALDDPDLEAWRDFVEQMQASSRDGQPVSWLGFANVHGNLAQGFNLCPHGNWYFLPWHRSYIRMYEVACRELTGKSDFALPFWDWTAHPDFPAAFGDPTYRGKPNPLFVEGRNTQTGAAIPKRNTGETVMERIYDLPTFEEFGSTRATGQTDVSAKWIKAHGVKGELEYNPHDNVHCIVAGPFMCSGASARDPIFQMHHCNIDRIWAEWNARGGEDSTDPLWRDMTFADNFIAPDGTTYSTVVRDLLVPEDLGYTYDLQKSRGRVVADPGRMLLLRSLVGSPSLMAEAQAIDATVEAGPITARPGDPASVSFRAAALGAAKAADPQIANTLQAADIEPKRVYAVLRNMRPRLGSETGLHVFVNAPDVTAGTRVDDNPNYVTSIGFFGARPIDDGPVHAGSAALVDLTPALRRLSEAGRLDGDDITVQLVPVGVRSEKGAGDVGIAEVELAVL